MMLAERNGVPLWSEFDDEYLASQFFTGEAGYGSLPAEKELALRQDNWIAGMGRDIDDGTPRYFKSTMDLRFKNLAVASWKPTSIAVNTTGLLPYNFITNPGFEVNTAGWTGASESRDTVQVFSGVGSLKITPPAGQPGGAQYVFPWNTQYQNQVLRVTAQANALGGSIRIGVDDGYLGNVWSSNYTGVTWGKMTLNTTIDANASVIWLNIEAVNITGGTDKACWLDDISVAATNGFIGHPRAFKDFGEDLYMTYGSVICNLSTTGSAFNVVARDLPGLVTDLEVFPDDKLYLALNYFAPYYEMTEAQAFTQTNLFPYFQFFKTVHSANPTMWGNQNANQVRSTTDPKAGGTAWSGVTNIGAAYHDITDLIDFGGLLYAMKENRPYYLNSSGAVQADLAPELEALLASTSGKNVHDWKGNLYIPCGQQGLLETDGTTNRFIHPGIYSSNLSDYAGRVMAVASDEEYLFIAVDNGSEIEILAGRDETISGVTDWGWHSIAELTIDGVETMHVSTKYQKRLWIASTNVSQSIYYIPLPVTYGDFVNDANRDFQSNTFMETPWLHGNFRDTNKAYPELTLSMGHAYDADIFFQAHYKTLSNSTYTFIANYKGSTTSMSQTNLLPDAGTNHPTDRMIRLKFTANTDDSTKTPQLLSYQLKGLLYPPRRTIIACTVKCAQETLLRDGTQDASFTQIKATLDEGRIATWPVSIRDINGDTRKVRFLPLPGGTPRWTLHKDEENKRQERWYNLLLQEVEVA